MKRTLEMVYESPVAHRPVAIANNAAPAIVTDILKWIDSLPLEMWNLIFKLTLKDEPAGVQRALSIDYKSIASASLINKKFADYLRNKALWWYIYEQDIQQAHASASESLTLFSATKVDEDAEMREKHILDAMSEEMTTREYFFKPYIAALKMESNNAAGVKNIDPLEPWRMWKLMVELRIRTRRNMQERTNANKQGIPSNGDPSKDSFVVSNPKAPISIENANKLTPTELGMRYAGVNGESMPWQLVFGYNSVGFYQYANTSYYQYIMLRLLHPLVPNAVSGRTVAIVPLPSGSFMIVGVMKGPPSGTPPATETELIGIQVISAAPLMVAMTKAMEKGVSTRDNESVRIETKLTNINEESLKSPSGIEWKGSKPTFSPLLNSTRVIDLPPLWYDPTDLPEHTSQTCLPRCIAASRHLSVLSYHDRLVVARLEYDSTTTKSPVPLVKCSHKHAYAWHDLVNRMSIPSTSMLEAESYRAHIMKTLKDDSAALNYSAYASDYDTSPERADLLPPFESGPKGDFIIIHDTSVVFDPLDPFTAVVSLHVINKKSTLRIIPQAYNDNEPLEHPYRKSRHVEFRNRAAYEAEYYAFPSLPTHRLVVAMRFDRYNGEVVHVQCVTYNENVDNTFNVQNDLRASTHGCAIGHAKMFMDPGYQHGAHFLMNVATLHWNRNATSSLITHSPIVVPNIVASKARDAANTANGMAVLAPRNLSSFGFISLTQDYPHQFWFSDNVVLCQSMFVQSQDEAIDFFLKSDQENPWGMISAVFSEHDPPGRVARLIARYGICISYKLSELVEEPRLASCIREVHFCIDSKEADERRQTNRTAANENAVMGVAGHRTFSSRITSDKVSLFSATFANGILLVSFMYAREDTQPVRINKTIAWRNAEVILPPPNQNRKNVGLDSRFFPDNVINMGLPTPLSSKKPPSGHQ